jgi:exodeoxyribonuclease VII small subunit
MSQHDDVDIGGTINRLEEIAETLEDGEVGLETAKELREEADEKLATLRDTLDVGDGDIIEIDGDELDEDTVE